MTEVLATLGGGCFWCLEAVFEQVEGVAEVRSGYAGGTVPHPAYKEVCSGTTGHAEVVQIRFDAEVIGYREILEIFFGIHDPTTLNRQGADMGTQYRSVIFHHSDDQRNTALDVIRSLDERGIWGAPIVTAVQPFEMFYVAEPEHREFFRRNPLQPYCQAVIAPKVAKFRKGFAHRIRPAT